MASRAVGILKILMVGLMVTAIMLSIIALCVQNFGWGESQINVGIIAVYVVSSLLGGFLLAYREKKRRLVYGIVFGIIYFGMLLLVSFAISKGNIDVQGMLVSLATCVVSGGIGGALVK